jgi:ubiquinone/menaquinone biosynthesis C-methylase UbiE
MRLFRRKQQGPSSGAAASQRGRSVARSRTPSASRASGDDRDWRSYDLIAQDYARTQAPALAVPAADLVELVQIGQGARVLDLGSGTGVAARAATAKAGPEGLVVGVDPSVEMLLLAGREGGGPRYAAATAIDLPFADQTFTHVVTNFVIAHFPKYDTAFFDILRVLKRGGRMGVTTWGGSDDRDEFRAAWRSVAEEFAEPNILSDAIKRVVPWEELFSAKDRLKVVLHDAGLRDIWVENRDYRFEMPVEDYLTGREAAATGRFLRQMLGEQLWGSFRARTREVFSERFPARINDFREVILAVGHKP